MRYQDLPDRDAHGFFGDKDALGSLNKQTPAAIAAAASLIVSGELFSLNAPLNWPDPPLFSRKPVQHTVFQTPLGNRDDYLDSFYPQASTQWDGFTHFRDPEVGFYNHLPPEELGIDVWARKGIAGRAVLLDFARHCERHGKEFDWLSRASITVEDLEAVRLEAGVEQRSGDILLVRTGWMRAYNSATPEEKAQVHKTLIGPGIDPSDEMAEYLWDWGVSAFANDTFGFEPMPPGPDTLHARILARLGIPIGELWDLEALAAHSAADGRYESFVTSAPLNIPGGVGSPANALAIK